MKTLAIVVFRIVRSVLGNGAIFQWIKKATSAFLEMNGEKLSDVIIHAQGNTFFKYVHQFGFFCAFRPTDRFIGMHLALTGVWEDHVVQVLLRYVRETTRFLDVGANIGFYTLLVATKAARGRVFAFEPDTDNFLMLTKGVTFNTLDSRVTLYNVAAGEKNEVLHFSDLGSGENSGARFTARDKETLFPHVHGPNPTFTSVNAVSIDSVLPDEVVDIVKLDIEGYEPMAFRGMRRLIERCRPVIFSEYAPTNLDDIGLSSAQAYHDLIKDAGYSIHIIDSKSQLVPVKDFAALDAAFGQSGVHHLDILCLPDS